MPAAAVSLIGVYGVLVLVYSPPLFEAPDSYYHFAVIEYIARTGQPPPVSIDPGEAAYRPWRQMTYHAPLYHRLSAWLISSIDTSDFLSRYPLNPHAQIGEPDARDNHNIVAHTGDPWKAAGLAARVVTGFSMVLGAVTLVGVWWLARGVFPQQPRLALMAMLVVLLNPQFLFISASINNDNLVVALVTWALALLVHIIRHGLTLWRLLVLAVLAACASLAKASGLALYPAIMVGVLVACWRDRVPLARIATYAVIGAAAFAIIAGRWYLQNWQRFGDPTASSMVAAATGLRGGLPVDVVGELRGLYYSFWGLFGWFNMLAPPWFYTLTMGVLVMAGIGALLGLWRGLRTTPADDRRIGGLLLLFVLSVVGAWWQFNTQVLAAQGRLWFPLLGVVACVVAYGLSRFTYGPLVLLPFALSTVVLPVLTLWPAYAPSPQIARAEWTPPEHAAAAPFREPWQDSACVVLWVAPPVWDGVSEMVLDVAWEARCETTGYWSVFVHLSDIEQETCLTGDTRHVLAQLDTMPDGGRTPLPALRIGYVLRDQLRLLPPGDLDRSRPWHMQIGLYDAGGTFIRAFVTPDTPDDPLYTSDQVFIGRCSPELVNVRVN
ncbi:MAG: hypothetical protein OHK0046_30800 [Anaerolineae bacterium]